MTAESKTLAPGGELDRLVAERLGIDTKPATHPQHDFNIDYHTYPDYPCKYCGLSEEEGVDKPCIVYPLINFYSTDIGAAWELVEKIKGNGYEFDLSWLPIDKTWEVGIYFPAEMVDKLHYGGVENKQDTAPLAICLAFLSLPVEEV